MNIKLYFALFLCFSLLFAGDTGKIVGKVTDSETGETLSGVNILLKGKQEVYNVGGKEETTIYNMAKIIGDRFDKKIVKGKVNNEVASSAPKKVSISLDRYEDEFGDFEFTTFKDGMKNYLDWYHDTYRSLNW